MPTCCPRSHTRRRCRSARRLKRPLHAVRCARRRLLVHALHCCCCRSVQNVITHQKQPRHGAGMQCICMPCSAAQRAPNVMPAVPPPQFRRGAQVADVIMWWAQCSPSMVEPLAEVLKLPNPLTGDALTYQVRALGQQCGSAHSKSRAVPERHCGAAGRCGCVAGCTLACGSSCCTMHACAGLLEPAGRALTYARRTTLAHTLYASLLPNRCMRCAAFAALCCLFLALRCAGALLLGQAGQAEDEAGRRQRGGVGDRPRHARRLRCAARIVCF